MAVSNSKKRIGRKELPPTKEFVVKEGTDATLWGDIDSQKDAAWGDKVWADMVKKIPDRNQR